MRRSRGSCRMGCGSGSSRCCRCGGGAIAITNFLPRSGLVQPFLCNAGNLAWPRDSIVAPPHELVFVPGEPNHDDVEKRDQQQPNRMGEAESVQLIQDEQREDENGGGIVRQFPSHQPGNQHQLHDAVAQEIKRREQPRADGKILRELNERTRHRVVRLLRRAPSKTGSEGSHLRFIPGFPTGG